MIGARRPYASPSKASASTLCQKCLKRGHYSYECTIAPQDRPYKTRPSRSQQLANPKLVPKLSNDVPNELLSKQGDPDDQLAKIQADREKQKKRRSSTSGSRSPSPSTHSRQRRRRRRSSGRPSSSSASVSTVSTNRSRSRSLSPHRMQDVAYPSQRDSQQADLPPSSSRKRRRSSSASSTRSFETASSYDRPGSYPMSVDRLQERNTRRRRSSISPVGRGRSRDYSADQFHRRRGHRRRSRSGSMDRSKIARYRHSLTPDAELQIRENARRASGHAIRYAPGNNGIERNHPLRLRSPQRDGTEQHRDRREAPPKPRERSLSPFSKRVALTKALNVGR